MCTDLDHRAGNYVILRMLSVRPPLSVLAKRIADAEKLNNLSYLVILFGRSIGLDRTLAS
jgi:hypothetical protein